ncbi:hypothetical protein [Shouchella clausii]|uniref:hypothetical protein n=1 Tax=Shouchella clausii TaxID=79880 RepID=UPI00226CFBC4|nr:hypothetical protein [Shouchella clausii]MCY1105841.1 hypothetical protein [Shouchella clausii]
MAITWISSHNTAAYITLDSQGRIYVSADARRIIKLPDKTGFFLTMGYDLEEQRLIVAKPEDVSADVEPFKFDNRAYCKRAAAILKGANLDKHAPPIRFYMIGDGEASKQAHLAYPSGTYAFALRD